MARETQEEVLLREVLKRLHDRGALPEPVDPLKRLLDPDFTEALWYYERSQTEPNIPGQLHPKQVEALHAPGFRWLFWANQSGKSTLGAIDAALFALGRHPRQTHPPPVTLWASALTWDLWEQILLPELLTWLPPERVESAPPPKRQSTNRTILVRADNGTVSRIVGKSAEQGAARYQSARVHRAWLDEEHPEAIYNELQPRLVRHGGEIISTMTPLLGLTWVYHRIYLPVKQGRLHGHYVSHAGLADNPSISPEAVEQLKRELRHDPVQLASRLFGEFGIPQGVALRVEERHMEADTLENLLATAAAQGWEHFCGIDFGFWRFGFVHLAADRAKRVHVLEEYFSQRETLAVRAEWIHTHLEEAGAPARTMIWGDSANPQDILEINLALESLGSPYRVTPVSKTTTEGKSYRRMAVSRLAGLLERGALLFRRGLGDGRVWRLRQSAASDGQIQLGSRLLYELSQWRYPKPKEEEKAQVQDPLDDTADGADLIAALRYAVVSWWKGAEYDEVDPDVSAWDAALLEWEAEQSRKVTPEKPKKGKRGAVRKPQNVLNVARLD